MKNMAIMCAFCMLAGGCATDGSPYRDPGEVRGQTTEFSAYDFQLCASAMVQSMLANYNLDRRLAEQFKDRRPVIAIAPLRNATYRMIDLRPMVDTIQSALVNSGKFDFVDRETERIMIDEIRHDMDSPLVADGESVGFKTQTAANYLLTGTLAEIRDDDGRTHESYYKLTMKLHNKRTGKIDWSGEKEIRKVGRRALIGK